MQRFLLPVCFSALLSVPAWCAPAIDLNLVPQVVEFEGFINYGSPIQTTSTNALGVTNTNVITPNVINQPIFSTRKVTTSVSIFDGQTVLLGGLIREDVQKVEDKTPFETAAAVPPPEAKRSAPVETVAPVPPAEAKRSAPATVGSGANTFTTVPGWGGIPDKLRIGPQHGGVVVDKKGNVYVNTDSDKGIYIFSADGALLRTSGPELSVIHSMCIREENGEEFIYAAQLKTKQVLKFKLDGTVVLKIPYPPESNLYPDPKKFSPTAVAVAPDGSIFVADGYGLSVIHKHDANGKYLKTFGSKGTEPGQFVTCHGISLDTRGGKPLLLVCDRENGRLQHFDMDGNFVAVIAKDLRQPAAASIHGNHVAVAELKGRVSILDTSNAVVATIGDNPDVSQRANFAVGPDLWQEGVSTAPHGISYDAAGNLYVAEWNRTGRVTKLIKSSR